jgi:hypothetical protein|tara:strand:- start:3178 stop:3411 length:234 start_codon:yes stop_codon:yes gene_type:complete
MFNPLVGDLSSLTDHELHEKLMGLRKRYFQTSNPDVQLQVVNTLNVYEDEEILRRDRAMQKSKDSDEDGLDGLIKVS